MESVSLLPRWAWELLQLVPLANLVGICILGYQVGLNRGLLEAIADRYLDPKHTTLLDRAAEIVRQAERE